MDTDIKKVKDNAKSEVTLLKQKVTNEVTVFTDSMDALQKDMDKAFGAIIQKMESKINK